VIRRRQARPSVAPPREVLIRLGALRELFTPPVLDEWGGSANLISGVEQLVLELQATLNEGPHRIVIEVPEREIEPGVEDHLRASVRRYCELRSEQLRHTRGAQVRDGLGALAIGLPVLFGGLVAITALHESSLPSAIETFFADGLLLVIAWVAVWYPLDTLFYYGRSLNRERHVLSELQKMDLVVRPAGSTPTPP
jgi:hypothetical protein